MQSIILLRSIASANSPRVEITAEEWQSIDLDLTTALTKIAGCASVHEAGGYLDELGELQTLLAKLHFKLNVPLSPRLRLLVREFDRSDDEGLRAFVFAKIKNAQFLAKR